MARKSGSPAVELDIGHRTVRITNPERVYFSVRGETKIDLAHYYLSVGGGIVRALRERPCMLHRFPTGVSVPKVHQKRLPAGAPPWVQTVQVDFPSGRSAHRGMHVYVRIEPRWSFTDVRRAARAFAHEVERRAPQLFTTAWWKRDRTDAVFVDWNQNTRDHTIRSAYSVRGVPEAVVSTPLSWDEVSDAEPEDFTMATVPERFARLGDVHAGIDDAVFSLEPLLEWADRGEHQH